jgi:soluble lytic murein transglycosylase-like protein
VISTADDVWIVSLTDREKELLSLVPDKRGFARKYGTPVALALAVARQDA